MRKGIIQVVPVANDRQPRSLVLLTGLKTLFQKQLPKMPREYIARLVYDNNSRCLAIIKRGYKVVGGICFRPFPHRGFAEIVFFATTSVDQVKVCSLPSSSYDLFNSIVLKGYGGMLMDHFKTHIKAQYPGMMHFLTYADNYAVGYFRKQGFSKEITLPRSVWAGYIKDYEGGTIMQCTMLPKVNYLEMRTLLAQQREAILSKIREMSKSHIVYDGLPQFQNGAGEGVTVDPQDVPGLSSHYSLLLLIRCLTSVSLFRRKWMDSVNGCCVSQAGTDLLGLRLIVLLTRLRMARPTGKSIEQSNMERLLGDLQIHPVAWAFLHPVNGDDVPDYYEVIKKPMGKFLLFLTQT